MAGSQFGLWRGVRLAGEGPAGAEATDQAEAGEALSPPEDENA
jgi:hypothetical protein